MEGFFHGAKLQGLTILETDYKKCLIYYILPPLRANVTNSVVEKGQRMISPKVIFLDSFVILIKFDHHFINWTLS